MITRVQVKNYRSLADVDVTLSPLTVLVGRNGAGKSTFVDVLRFLKEALSYGAGFQSAVEGRRLETLRHRKPSGSQVGDIEVSVEVKDAPRYSGVFEFGFDVTEYGSYSITHERAKYVSEDVTDEYRIINERWEQAPLNPFILHPEDRTNTDRPRLRFDKGELALYQINMIIPDLSYLSALLHSTNFFTLSLSGLRQPQKSIHTYPIREDGANLAAVLRKPEESKVHVQSVLAVMKSIFEDIRDLRVEPIGEYLIVQLQHARSDGDVWFDLADESDGTLRALAIFTALYQEGPHQLLVIEEPENTLHPGALDILAEVAREASQRCQIILTTQSPDLISKFKPNELRIVEKVDGATRIGPLADYQIEIINRELFKAGDLLRIEGLHTEPVVIPVGSDA